MLPFFSRPNNFRQGWDAAVSLGKDDKGKFSGVLLFLEIPEFWFAVVSLWPVEGWGSTNRGLSQTHPDFLGDDSTRLEQMLIF